MSKVRSVKMQRVTPLELMEAHQGNAAGAEKGWIRSSNVLKMDVAKAILEQNICKWMEYSEFPLYC